MIRENFLTSDLSISGNFEQLWFLWQKSTPPPHDKGKFFDFRSIHFRLFWTTLFFVAEKPPPQGWEKFFWLQIYPFQAISSNFGFCDRKALPPRMRENFLTADLSISGNFKQLWFLWQRSPPPPRMMENFLTSDLSISGLCIRHVEYPRSPYYKSILRFLLSKYLL